MAPVKMITLTKDVNNVDECLPQNGIAWNVYKVKVKLVFPNKELVIGGLYYLRVDLWNIIDDTQTRSVVFMISC